ncbi:MAG: 3-dehydroquinate synthase [Desulfovibrio sp.]|uniref:3-dehydroquinate synthase n=1 Tax=Desulfovibrio sp. 7SRBS1 TaxID=3378064 RepID=UPI003B3FC6F6
MNTEKTPETIRVSLQHNCDASYDIYVGENLLAQLPGWIAECGIGSRYCIVCDTTTERLFGRSLEKELDALGIDCALVSVPCGEASKSLGEFGHILDSLRRFGFDRSGCVIALGGGVVGDLAGYVAGCYMRGIPFIQVPTTLLSQVDSSVGGKVAVNIESGKNFCGLFYQPRHVCIDVAALDTLPREEMNNGLAEVIKTAIIRNHKLFDYLSDNVEGVVANNHAVVAKCVAACCRIKAEVVEADEREGNVRMILNYGHTVGHAIEAASGYTLGHGLCVAYGMRIIAEVAERLGIFPHEERRLHDALLDRYKLAVNKLDMNPDAIMSLLSADKKVRQGKNIFILPKAIGEVEIRSDIPLDQVAAAVQTICS